MVKRKHRRMFAVPLALAALNLLFPQQVALAHELPVGEKLIAAYPLSKLPEVASVPIPEPVVKNRMVVVVTAYTSTRDQTDSDPFTTASGAKVSDGIIAMNGVAFGTRVRFPGAFGDKVFVVKDRMNARMGRDHADIWMKSRPDAIQWGRRTQTIEFLK